MRPGRIVGLTLTLLLIATTAATRAAADAAVSGSGKSASSDRDATQELLVRYKDTAVTPDAIAAATLRGAGVERVHPLRVPPKLRGSAPDAAVRRLERWRRVRLAPGVSPDAMRKQLAADPNVEFVEPSYVYRASVFPNDPSFSRQWGLHNIGQTGGEPGADIDAPEAWSRSTGSRNVVVAVIDSGVDYNHADLRANMWVNSGEIAGNGKDDDGNGFIDDHFGYDFANDDGSPMDDFSHGTHVAGTIAAVGNNGIGVAGVSWKARIMAVKFLGADGSGTTADAIDAILYATAMGARIINASWGGADYSQALADAIAAAGRRGVLFVAAAGNEGGNNDAIPSYPGSYGAPNVISVAATDDIDGLAFFSNYGRRSVHLGAPGVEILSTIPRNRYDTFSGTSMAAPHVSGAAALLLAQDTRRKASYLKMRLLASVDSVDSLSSITVSGGRLNINRAMDCSPAKLELNPAEPARNFSVARDQPVTLRAWIGACEPAQGASATVTSSTGEAPIALFDDGAHGDGDAGDGFYANTWIPRSGGPVELTFQASDATHGAVSARIAGFVQPPYTVRKPAYAWIDASKGTPLTLDDDASTPIDIGFDFRFYGKTYSRIFVGSNGLLSFGEEGSTQFWNGALPDPAAPNATIAPFWDDLNPAAGGRVYARLIGAAPNRRLVVAWLNVAHYYSPGAGSFEAVLSEADSSILFQYRDVDFGSKDVNRGAGATVGIENETGRMGVQYSRDQPLLQNNSAIRFARSNRPPVANPDSAQVARNGVAAINVLANDSDADGDTLAVTLARGPGHGKAMVNPDGSIGYRPASGFTGEDAFSYSIRDGYGGTATTTGRLTVGP